MAIPFQVVDNLDRDDKHQLRVYEVADTENDDWLLPMAREYVRLLTYSEHKPGRVEQLVAGIDLDTASIKQCLLEDSIPKSRGGNFDVVRSDFGELLCYMLLEQDYQTMFGWKSLAEREARDLTARGIDAIGVEYDAANKVITLVLCEVKVSKDDDSPPGVVDANRDCLKKQHLYHLAGLYEETRAKVHRHARLARDEAISALLEAVVLCLAKRLDLLKVVACSVLVRPTAKYKSTDFGSFRTNSSQYQPASIRFLIPCIPDELDVIMDKWYKLVQSMEVSL